MEIVFQFPLSIQSNSILEKTMSIKRVTPCVFSCAALSANVPTCNSQATYTHLYYSTNLLIFFPLNMPNENKYILNLGQ